MAKTILISIFIVFFILLPVVLLAQGGHSHEEEIKEGRSLLESRISCQELTDKQLEAIGEYLMEQMHPGESHEAMHQMMGMKEGTEYHKNFHINLAKTMYCGQGSMNSMMSMMGMMGNRSNYPWQNLSNPLMGNMMTSSSPFGWWGSWNWLGWVFMILFWVLIIVGTIALIKWLIDQAGGRKKEKSPLDILKERYAKGEISKEEFEEKKKDLI
jgi:uncharacterized membrane protein